jgi:uncharacterized membrane protein YhaH (DUF805 family)
MSRRSWAQTLLKLYFSPVGRIRPSLYWLALAALAALGLGINAIYGIFFNGVAAFQAIVVQSPGPGAGTELGADGLSFHGTPLSAVIFGAFVLTAFCVQAKRLHDAGRSAGWLVALAVAEFVFPFAAGWLIFRHFDLGGLRWVVRYTLICAVVGMGGPLAFKLWVGLARSRPEPNAHGPRPETPLAVATPPRKVLRA